MADDKGYEIITDRIVSMLEQGTVPWRKPWSEAAGGAGHPTSIRNRPYRGFNVFVLASQGYGSPYWLTFKQALELGGNVKKGEHATPVILWKTITAKARPGEQVEPGAKPKTFPILVVYRLFNTEQTEGCTWPKAIAERLAPREVVITPEPERIAACEAIVASMPNPPVIRWGAGNGRAFYTPSTDQISMPRRESFLTSEGVYDTLLHELVHSTGAKSRLDRESVTQSTGFGTHTYGREELIAEMGTAFLAGEAGILPATVDNNAAYCASWIKAIREDKRAIIVAAGAAQRAADYILNRAAAQTEEVAA
jgi:antirestriction protein ArdC